MSVGRRVSLAAAFAPESAADRDAGQPTNGGVDRAAGLTGLLPTRSRSPVSSEGPPAPTGRPAEPGAEESQAGTDEFRVDEGDLDRVRNVAVYLPPDLLDRLRRTARSRELTYADLLTEAANAHLDAVVAQFRPAPRPIAKGGGMPARPRRRAVEPGVQRQIRLDGHQLAWLAVKASEIGAPSRNALMVALLRAHLGGTA